MIYLYTGTPGSGKSLDVAIKIYQYNTINKPVICNFPVNLDRLKKRKNKDSFVYKNDFEMTPRFLMEYSEKNLKHGKEGQALIVIDEAQRLFNARDYNMKSRRAWITFFQLHRHYGYNIILVTQYDRLIDRQIRSLVEYEIIHRKLNNYGLIGSLLGFFFMGSIFVRIEYWYGMRERVSSSFYRGKRKYYKLYDSYASFDPLEYKRKQQMIDKNGEFINVPLDSFSSSSKVDAASDQQAEHQATTTYECSRVDVKRVSPSVAVSNDNIISLYYTDDDLNIPDWEYSPDEVSAGVG